MELIRSRAGGFDTTAESAAAAAAEQEEREEEEATDPSELDPEDEVQEA